MSKVDFKTSGYFPPNFSIVGIAAAVGGLLLLVSSIVITGLVILVISVIVLTTHYRLSIDMTQKVYHEYVWILGMKSGEKKRFNSVEYIFINRNKVSQTMRSRIQSSTFHKEVFDAYVKFSDDTKIHLATAEEKDPLQNSVSKIALTLGTEVVDYTA